MQQPGSELVAAMMGPLGACGGRSTAAVLAKVMTQGCDGCGCGSARVVAGADDEEEEEEYEHSHRMHTASRL